MDSILRMTLKNSEPVDLIDFTKSCQAFADEFNRYSKSHDDGQPARLLIKQVRTGSIEIDLIQFAPLVAPLVAAVAEHPMSALSTVNTVVSFVKNFKSLCGWLKGDNAHPEEPVDRKTLENVETWLEPVAKDAHSEINVCVVTINGDVNAPIFLNSQDANVCQNVAKRKRQELAEPQSGDIREQVLLRWHQSRNSVLGRGDMAIIEAISAKPLRVVFQNKGMKSLLLSADDNMFKKPYLADVIVDSVEGAPKLYRIVAIEPIEEEE